MFIPLTLPTLPSLWYILYCTVCTASAVKMRGLGGLRFLERHTGGTCGGRRGSSCSVVLAVVFAHRRTWYYKWLRSRSVQRCK